MSLSRRAAIRHCGAIALVVTVCNLAASNDSVAQVAALADVSIGRADASLTIIEHASMTSHHCATFHRRILPLLKSEYIDTGKVRLIYRDFPLDELAFQAAMMARCVGSERYFRFVDTIYRAQDSWHNANNPLKAVEHLAWHGFIGADEIKACLDNKQVQDYVLQSRLDADKQFAIDVTPTFVIDGKGYSAIFSYSELKQIIDPLIASKSGASTR